MKLLRVVLYAEGPGEAPSFERLALQPGTTLDDSRWGPAHVLFNRVFGALCPDRKVAFEAPLRDHKGKVAHGSRLHDPTRLKKLLTWAMNAPDLAIVLVDADGNENERRRDLKHACDQRRLAFPPAVVAVAVEEFEAWALIDQNALRRVFPGVALSTSNQSVLPPRAAKAELQRLAGDADSGQAKRMEVFRHVDLEVLKARSRSFEDAWQDIGQALRE